VSNGRQAAGERQTMGVAEKDQSRGI